MNTLQNQYTQEMDKLIALRDKLLQEMKHAEESIVYVTSELARLQDERRMTLHKDAREEIDKQIEKLKTEQERHKEVLEKDTGSILLEHYDKDKMDALAAQARQEHVKTFNEVNEEFNEAHKNYNKARDRYNHTKYSSAYIRTKRNQDLLEKLITK